MENIIEVKKVSKDFKIHERQKGLYKSIQSLFQNKYVIKKAVNDISFNIKKGEIVGYIGANGAGKSTTIKMLSGILVPSSGSIMINGIIPYENRKENAKKIGVVFGQRSQLYWNLPMEETFDLYKKIYKIPDKDFKDNVNFYVELLGMTSFLRTPVRQLSLGQRMRAELVVALLHNPEILYLDEPTIGLDVVVKQKIRTFIKEINREKKITVILTTHDMDDIEQICNRIITIHSGEIVYDGSINHFKNKYSLGHQVIVEFTRDDVLINDPRFKIIESYENRMVISFNKDEIKVAEVLNILSKDNEILDIQLKEPDIEDAVGFFYK
ncbi:ABC transporter ATP-binding protein [Paenibacillus andongensis]|uniref:ABC transporter ATP-binding protein n=1 Tax=Paenibacillus andongensis TaxID=2975482 RepID=UPI0021BA7B10|nr:ATP-binding cassette domain-containing protein [Paenibacillus andongensis]